MNDEEESVYTDRNRGNLVSYPTVSAIQNKKQLPSISSNGNRPSLTASGRSKTSNDDFNSSRKPHGKQNENGENNESKPKLEQHSDIENHLNKNSNEKDLNNNGNEISYTIETVLKYLEEEYYLR
jgi:hypothetical protein